MALTLLDRVKNKAFEALNAAGNFFNQNVAQPVQQTVQNVQTATPQIQRNLSSSVDSFLKAQAAKPAIPALGPFSPNTGDALNTIADFTYRPVARLGYEGAQTLSGDRNTYQAPKGFGELLLGTDPLRNFTDPNRPAAEFSRNIGHPELTYPLVGVGGALSVLPVNPAKVGIKGVTKTAEKLFGKAGAKAVEEIATSKPTTSLFQDAVKPGNVLKAKGTAQKLFEDTFRSSKGVIEKAGPAGKEIVRRLNTAEGEAANLAGKATERLQSVMKKLKGAEVDTFADVAEGKLQPVSALQANAVNTWKNIAADVAAKAKQAGLDIGIRENYFPHQIGELNKADKLLMAKDMVANGKFATEAEALQSLEQEIGSLARGAERRFGNLELPRETNLPYNKSPNVLFDYIQKAYGRIADAKHLGSSDELLYKLASAAGTQGGDTNQIVKYLDQILGKNQTQSKIAQKLQSLQTITKLNPVTSAVNLTQNLSTWLRTDTGTMFKTLGQVVTNPKKAYAIATRVGEITPDMAKQLEDYAGTGSAAGKWIRLIGMQGTEKFNRVMAVNAGANYAEKLAKQASKGSEAAIRELQRFGVNLKDVKNGVLSDKALKSIARQVSGATQFSTKPGELPYFWRTNIGKVVTQFKSFAYKQTGFMKDQAVRVGSEAAKGNVKPLVNTLVTLGIAAPIAGEIVNDFKSLIRNKKRDDVDSLTERYFSNILAATSFGLLDSTNALFGQYGESGVISTIGGPTAGDVVKAGTAVADTSGGLANYDPERGFLENVDPNNTTQRNLLKEIPGVGQTASNTLVDNSYVDNVFGGVNEGLNKKDKETYRQLQETDPAAAERFKAANQQKDKAATEENGNFFENFFGGGKKGAPTWDKKPTTKKEQEAYNKMVDTAFENGADVPDNAIKERYFKGKDYTKKDISDRKDILESMIKVENDEFLTDDQKARVAQAAGIPPAELEYYKMASMDVPEKLQGLLSFAEAEHPDRQQFITSLIQNKKAVGGKSVLSSDMVDSLYDRGLIDKEEKALINAVKYDQIYERFYVDRDYQAKYGKGGTNDQASSKKLAAKIKTYINGLNSLNKDSITTENKNDRVRSKISTVKAPAAPRLNLNTQPGSKSSSQWFRSY